MKFIREDYKETQRRKTMIISVSLAAAVVLLLSYFLFISKDTPVKKEVVTPEKIVEARKKRPKQKVRTKTKEKKDLPTIFAETKRSVVLIKTYDNKNRPIGIGSGFFINAGGHLISNRHVFKNAHRAEVEGVKGKFPIKKVLAVSSDYDLVRVVVDIGSRGVTPLKTNKTLPKIGESVLVIGNPLGLESTVSDGIVSALRKLKPFGTVIQITSPISPGSSGSPVLNMQGEVIGIATFQLREGQNLNFAIPISRLKDLRPSKDQTLAAVSIEDPEMLESMGNPFDQGMVLFNGKNYAAAIPYFKKAISENPQNAEAYYHLGICYRETNATDAIDAFKTAIDFKSDYAEAYCHLGITYQRLNMREEAIEALREALRISPDYDEALLNLGIVYALSKKYNSAVSVLERSTDVSGDAKAFYYLGFSYSQLKKHAKAARAFRQSMDMDPDFLDAYLGLGASYAAVENWRLGIRILNQAVIMAPQNPQVHFLLGILHLGNDDLESAQREYELLKKQKIPKELYKLRSELRNAISKYKYSRKRRYR